MIVNTIAKEVTNTNSSPIIAALCQLKKEQFEITIRSLEPAISNKKARLHTYLPVDPQLMDALGNYGKNFSKITKDVFELIKIRIHLLFCIIKYQVAKSFHA